MLGCMTRLISLHKARTGAGSSLEQSIVRLVERLTWDSGAGDGYGLAALAELKSSRLKRGSIPDAGAPSTTSSEPTPGQASPAIGGGGGGGRSGDGQGHDLIPTRAISLGGDAEDWGQASRQSIALAPPTVQLCPESPARHVKDPALFLDTSSGVALQLNPPNFQPPAPYIPAEDQASSAGPEEAPAAERLEYLDRKEMEWFSILRQHIGADAGGPYIELATESLWQIKVSVYIRREHWHKVSHVDTDTQATGVGGVIGNKGGAAVSLQLGETRLCFVSSHLAAHKEHMQRRNENYKDIIHGLGGLGRKGWGFRQFDHVFWMGDLNYRIDNLSHKEVLKLTANEAWDTLYEHDQLRQQMLAGYVFHDFQELQPRFPPTFR